MSFVSELPLDLWKLHDDPRSRLRKASRHVFQIASVAIVSTELAPSNS
jgi:hypothetical protein